MNVLLSAGDAAKGDQRGRKGGMSQNASQTNIFKIVKMVMEKHFAPLIIFSFSKKECEAYAMQMAKLDFNTLEEKKLVDEVFNNAMEVLSEEDRQLPQVENVLPLLRRGIGIHHGGLLPILKETIEILFGEGLIKALFATETFAMGLNMPARTVLFTSPRKFDGKETRWITSGEYIQMSGRAGRRGLDDKGIVILMIDEKVSKAVGKDIVQGKPDPINSAFHLTYNMVLNLLRVEEINPEYMLERSFFQFQNQSSIPTIYKETQEKQKEFDDFHIPNEENIASYYQIRDKLDNLGKQFRTFITTPTYLVPFLQPGRLIKVQNNNDEFDWGIVINFKKQSVPGNKNPLEGESSVSIDVLLHLDEDSFENSISKPCLPNKKGVVEVVPVVHTFVSKISSLRIAYPQDLRPKDNRRAVLKTIAEVQKRFPNGLPLLNPITDMNIKDSSFKNIVELIDQFEKKLFTHPLHQSPQLEALYAQYCQKLTVENELKIRKDSLRKAKSLLQMDELKYRKRVLRRLGYCTSTDVIEFKGRVACELSSGDELLITEMIFNGVFNNLSSAQCVSLLSCFVCTEKSSEAPASAEELSGK